MIDQYLDDLIKRGFVPEEDVAWIGVTEDEIRDIPGLSFICPIRSCMCKSYRGVEIRVSIWARETHKVRHAWNITGRTKPLFPKEDVSKK